MILCEIVVMVCNVRVLCGVWRRALYSQDVGCSARNGNWLQRTTVGTEI